MFRRLAMLVLVLGWLCAGRAAWSQNVVVNEIHYNPAPGFSPDAEFIELFNPTGNAISLSGWSLSDAVVFAFPAQASIPAQGYLVVAKSVAQVFIATGYTPAFQWTSGSLANGGETLRLRNSASVIVDEVAFDDDFPWPPAADAGGPSLELLDPAFDNAYASVWESSTGNNGTPGAQNSRFSGNPVVLVQSPFRSAVIQGLPSVTVTFSEAVTGVTAADLLVDGSSATDVTGNGAGPYVFSGYAAPSPGSVSVELQQGPIQDGLGNGFQGAMWTYLLAEPPRIVINEIHYHPDGALFPLEEVEFVELYNADAGSIDLSNWYFAGGITFSFPPGTIMSAGSYLVIATNSAALESATGYAGGLQWTAGSLSNGGERIALSNDLGSIIDEVNYDDSGLWPGDPDGGGSSLELVNPGLPNDAPQSWGSSVPANGTPGAQNSVFVADPAPLITHVLHSPSIPAANASVTVVATVLTDSPAGTTVTLLTRQDQNPPIAYSSVQMLDDGLHNDGASHDGVYGATVPGLAEGERLDFYVTALEGATMSTAPSGHVTPDALGNPSQTLLCKFSSAVLPTDFHTYHIIRTEANRLAQESASPPNELEYDATFIDGLGNVFYNVSHRYRGSTSLLLDPKSFRVNFSDQSPLQSELGYPITRLQLVGRFAGRQMAAYQNFDAAGLEAPDRQYIRLNVNPTNNTGNINGTVYINVERIDSEFLSRRYAPDEADGNLYRGRDDADLRWEGPTVGPPPVNGPYRLDAMELNGYEKITNELEDTWDDVITLCDALTCAQDSGQICTTNGQYSDPSYVQPVNSIIDEDQWCRWFAVQSIISNQEGGLYRDTGDDYFIYFQQTGAVYPQIADYRAVLFPWDMDSAMRIAPLDSIWRTTTPAVQRLLRHNAFAPLYVSAIRSLIDGPLSQAAVNARIDAIPNGVLNSGGRNAMKTFYADRLAHINAEIVSQLTINGVPSSPYSNPVPLLHLSGTLNQAGTFGILVNGVPATHSCYLATWSADFTLAPGNNSIVVQALGRNGEEIGRLERAVEYDLCPSDPNKFAPGLCGCGVSDVDSDGDATPDCTDGCPLDPSKVSPGLCGCGVAETDSDGDATPDCNDGCPLDPNKVAAGLCGCGLPDTDSDTDTIPDCNDGCPLDPNKSSPGLCGCGVPDVDTDGDTVLDCNDGCPLDPNKTDPGLCGCGLPDTDSDGDTVLDCNDGCPLDPAKTSAGQCGCGNVETDSDNDGTADCVDGCPLDPNKAAAGQCGCGSPETDSDNDGTSDCIDGCPQDSSKIVAGQCGCGNPETDSDNDGVADCVDGCPNDAAKTEPGLCGCGTQDTDSDGDLTPNCNDGCPVDPNKTAPGLCGCGVPDTDSDNDAAPDCQDGCPLDPNKTAPGACGCGTPDTDTDGDGTLDCQDDCPLDPDKTSGGTCGCGIPDSDFDGDGILDCDDPCPGQMRLAMPGRMVAGKTMTLRVDLLDAEGNPDRNKFDVVGHISARRQDTLESVPISTTVFDDRASSIEPRAVYFHNGVAAVSFTLDNGAAEPPGNILVSVSVGAVSVSGTVGVLSNPAMRNLTGTLGGADLTWSAADGVIHLIGNVTVPNGQTLSIGPGTLVMIDAGSPGAGTRILVQGAIDAEGTADDPIFIFPTDGAAALSLVTDCLAPTWNPHAWRGINHQNGNASTYSHVFITGCGNGTARPPILQTVSAATITVSDCVFADNNGKVVLASGTGGYTFRDSLMTRCGAGAEFSGNGEYTLLVKNCWITDTGHAPPECDREGDLLGIRAAVPATAGTKTVRDCVLTDGGDDAIDILGAPVLIENCIMYNLRDKGISLDLNLPGSITLRDSLLFDSGSIGVRAAGGAVTVERCTIGSLLPLDTLGCGNAVCSDSIIWPEQQSTCCGAFSNCIVGAGSDTSCGAGNIAVDPEFVDAAGRNFDLGPDSPARTAGISGGRIGWVPTVSFPVCRADWNHDCSLDSQDFFDFIDAFFNGSADYNGFDGTDSQDYFDFLDGFFTGCE